MREDNPVAKKDFLLALLRKSGIPRKRNPEENRRRQKGELPLRRRLQAGGGGRGKRQKALYQKKKNLRGGADQKRESSFGGNPFLQRRIRENESPCWATGGTLLIKSFRKEVRRTGKKSRRINLLAGGEGREGLFLLNGILLVLGGGLRP